MKWSWRWRLFLIFAYSKLIFTILLKITISPCEEEECSPSCICEAHLNNWYSWTYSAETQFLCNINDVFCMYLVILKAKPSFATLLMIVILLPSRKCHGRVFDNIITNVSLDLMAHYWATTFNYLPNILYLLFLPPKQLWCARTSTCSNM